MLKTEMDRVNGQLGRRHNDKHEARKKEIEDRMSAITLEMSSVLSKAKAEVPGMRYDVPVDDSDSDSSLEEEEQSTIKTEKMVTHDKVQRTYDSTDSDADSDDDDSDDEMRGRPEEGAERVVVESMLVTRRSLLFGGGVVGMAAKKHDESDDGNSDDVVEDSGGTGAGKLLRGLKGAMKAAGEKGAKAISPKMRTLTDDELDDLRVEESRLERQTRKLKRKNELSGEEDAELQQAESRLAEVRERLESGVVQEESSTGKNGPKAPKNLFGGKRDKDPSSLLGTKSPRGVASPTSKASSPFRGDDDESHGSAPLKDEEPYEGPGSKATKGTAVRALGRLKKNMKGAKGAAEPEQSGARSRASARAGLDNASASSNVYSQVTDKLAKRGEKLGNLENRTDEMTDNATEMHSAAANLRRRQQEKNNRFFR